MDPNYVEIVLLTRTRFAWAVDFDDTGLSQRGNAKTYAEAMACVVGAVENANGETR
jgi:hypothetical protein